MDVGRKLRFCRGRSRRHLLSSLAASAPVVYRQYRLSRRGPADPELSARGMPQRRCQISIGVNADAAHGASHCGTMIWNDCAVSLRLRRGSGRVPCLLRVRRSPTASRATNSEARSAATRFDGALNAAARNRMRRLVVDRFCISATRVTRLSAGLRRSAGANHQFLGWRFPLLFYGAATEFLARK